MDKVISCMYKKPNATTRLICFPWAGGGSIFFANWGKLFDESVEVYSVRLAGRESRSQEPFAQNMDQIVDEVSQSLLPHLQEKTFAFFGHSMGSFTSFATALRLKEKYGLEPVHLFVSGVSAPHSKTRYPIQRRSDMSDEYFLHWMAGSGGTPVEVLQNKEAAKLFIPPLKADIRVLESFIYEKPAAHVLSCGLTCFDGASDNPHDLEAWKDLTSGDFNIYKLPGDHFYLKDPANQKQLVSHVTKYLENFEMTYL